MEWMGSAGQAGRTLHMSWPGSLGRAGVGQAQAHSSEKQDKGDCVPPQPSRSIHLPHLEWKERYCEVLSCRRHRRAQLVTITANGLYTGRQGLEAFREVQLSLPITTRSIIITYYY